MESLIGRSAARARQAWITRRRLVLGLAALLPPWCGPARAQAEEGMDEAHVKAAFLYKFTGYVDWPDAAFERPEAPFVMGVLGAPVLLGALSELVVGRKVRDRAIRVRKMQAGESAAGLHLLFVGRAEPLRGEAAPRPVLVVTEVEGSLPRGSMINFLLIERRVRFEIALPNVEKAGLRVSSRLLGVAQRVIQDEEH